MDGLRQYLLQLICAAFVCGIVLALLPKGGIRQWLQWICGIFLTVTLLAPVTDGKLDDVTLSFPDYRQQANAEAESGAKIASQARKEIIKQTAEAYVLDKAKAQGVELAVEITVEDGVLPVPVAAHIRGDLTQEQKQLISQVLEEDLGIPKEAQIWIGAA